jgi:hypothetical protein
MYSQMTGAMSERMSALQGNPSGPIGQAMNQATSEIASAVAHEMIAAVTQAAMPYTGQGNAFGQVKAGVSGSGYAQRAAQMEQQMRASILAPQLPTRSLMPIRGR